MNDLQISTLLSEGEIQNRVKEIGKELTEKFNGEPVIAVCILKGSIMFFADLVRAIDSDIVCEFMGLSSYQDAMSSSGEVKLTLDINSSINDKHLVLVEDIIDTGITMNYLQQLMRARKPKTITTVTLLHKPDSQKESCEIDIVGFKIPSDFVVGYGLDYQGLYRNLPYIGQVSTLN